MNHNYSMMYICSVVVAVLGAMLVAINAAGDRLGINSIVLNWLGIANAGLIILAGLLPSVRKPPSDDRVGMD